MKINFYSIPCDCFKWVKLKKKNFFEDDYEWCDRHNKGETYKVVQIFYLSVKHIITRSLFQIIFYVLPLFLTMSHRKRTGKPVI